MSQDRADRALTGFYVHLVAMTCAQLAVVVVALAQRAVPLWYAAALVTTALSLAGHGAVTLAPRPAGRR
jgi:hypothetical protein